MNNTQSAVATNAFTTNGYKQTVLGLIPIDWEIKELQDISYICSGGTPSRKNISYWKGNIPWVTTSQIDFNTIIEANEFITEEGLQNSAAKIFEKGTLVLAMYGQGKTRGKIAILGIKATTNQACAAICLNRDISKSFVFLTIASRYEEIRNLSNSGSQENLNGAIIKKIKMLLPPLHEQEAIASALSNVDFLINAIDVLIIKKRQIKQGIMQQLLTGKKRLPGFSGKWDIKNLSEISTINMGRTPSRDNDKFWGVGYKWISIADLQEKIICNTKEQITGLAAEFMTIIPKGTLIMSFKLSIGRLAFVNENMYSNEAICSFSKLNANKQFMYYILQRTDFSLYGKQAVKGFTLNKGSLNAIRILYPPLEEQQAIAQLLSDVDAEIEHLTQKLEKTKALKQGMMQELLTGKTRLV